MPGPFHRLESDTQTAAIAVMQVASSEIWGRAPRGGRWPTVQAYPGAIPAGSRGIQFRTPIEPHSNGSPFEVRWYLGLTDGVEQRFDARGEEFACIRATVANHQL